MPIPSYISYCKQSSNCGIPHAAGCHAQHRQLDDDCADRSIFSDHSAQKQQLTDILSAEAVAETVLGIALTIDVIDAFVSRAKTQPDRAAVMTEAGSFSYLDLFNRSSAIASELRRLHDAPRVLIAQERGFDAYASMIATLMVGGHFCPINVSQPPYRTQLIVSSFQPNVILGNEPHLFSYLTATNIRPADVTISSTSVGNFANSDLGGYVIFTSGSTGIPKGVSVRRECLSKFVESFSRIAEVRIDDRWAQFSNLGFDLSIVDTFMTLTAGAALVPVVSPLHRLFPARCINELGVTIWHSVPSVVDLMIGSRLLNRHHLATLRLASFCGEPLKLHHVESLFDAAPTATIVNTYGPTEGTLFSTALSMTQGSYLSHFDQTFSIGAPLDGWRIDLKGGDKQNEGEIVISGRYISDGYINDDELTGSRFKPDLIEPKTVSYLTGDWARYVNDGLYFTSRIDRQVKLKGHRLELGEIEFHVGEVVCRNCHAFVSGRVVAVAIEGIAFLDADEIRQALEPRLPEYAIPSRFEWIEQFPRNANDKVDYSKLKQMVE